MTSNETNVLPYYDGSTQVAREFSTSPRREEPADIEKARHVLGANPYEIYEGARD